MSEPQQEFNISELYAMDRWYKKLQAAQYRAIPEEPYQLTERYGHVLRQKEQSQRG